MTILNIYKVEDQLNKEALLTLTTGEHVLGRGPALQCEDMRVSRRHVLLTVSEENATIKSVHINPCFYIIDGTIKILTQNSSAVLKSGDKFALLPEDFWFKIQIVKDTSQSNKRSIDEELGEPKRVKVEEEAVPLEQSKEPEVQETNVESLLVQDNIENVIPVEEIKQEPIPTEVNDVKPILQEVKTEIKEEPEHSPRLVPFRLVVIKPRSRERCWFGKNCYRKNPEHFARYCHPNDSDFNADVPPNSDDNRPSCSYGQDCYRNHPNHRRDYNHPEGAARGPCTPYCSCYDCLKHSKPGYESDCDEE